MIGQQDMVEHCSPEVSEVAGAIAGDHEALSALWQRHRRWVAAVLLTHRPAGVDLEDLLQETAMRLVSRIDTLRDEGNVRAWLRAVAVNVARSAARRQRIVGQPQRELSQLEDLRFSVSEDLDDETTRVLTLVSQLPEEYREPLLLRAARGMKTKQIAQILDLAPATVDTRIARARRMLRDRSSVESSATSCGRGGPDSGDLS